MDFETSSLSALLSHGAVFPECDGDTKASAVTWLHLKLCAVRRQGHGKQGLEQTWVLMPNSHSDVKRVSLETSDLEQIIDYPELFEADWETEKSPTPQTSVSASTEFVNLIERKGTMR